MPTFQHRIILRTDAPRKDRTCLVCLQKFLFKKRVVIPLKVHVHQNNWDPVNKKINYWKGADRKIIDNYNRIIANASARAIDIATRYHLSARPLTPENFLREMLQDDAKDDFIQFVKLNLPELSKLKEKSTIKKYTETLTKLQLFKPQFTFSEINEKFVIDFEVFMRKGNLGLNTRHRFHKTIKVFLNYAKAQNIFIENPYSRFKPKRAKGTRTYLEGDELRKLIGLLYSGNITYGHYRVLRYFLFACFTGLRISDVHVISDNEIIGGEIVFIPVKSKNLAKICRVPLNATAISLIENPEGKLFNTVTSQYTNIALKEIVSYVGIKKHVTFHVARHTFATQYLVEGGKVENLKEALGHTKLETTMEYVHLIDKSRKQGMMQLDNITKIPSHREG